jgi:hypothetical protein
MTLQHLWEAGVHMGPWGPAIRFTSHNMEIYNPFKVDVYSYAIICFEILTRVIQFAKIHVSKIKVMTKGSTRPTLPTSLPKFLLSLIEQRWDER